MKRYKSTSIAKLAYKFYIFIVVSAALMYIFCKLVLLVQRLYKKVFD